MGIKPPLLHHARNRNIDFVYEDFSPKAQVYRASRAPKPLPPPPKDEGRQLVEGANATYISVQSSPASNASPSRKSFPLIQQIEIAKQMNSLPTHDGSPEAKRMNPSTKMRVTKLRIVQLVLRYLELLGALGLLGVTILLKGIPIKIGLIIRIPLGIAIAHTMYGAYHHWRRPSGRTPGSSATYQLFAACFDVSLLPFYVFSAILLLLQYTKIQDEGVASQEWSTIVGDQALLPTFLESAFFIAVITAGLHLISFLISCWLATLFWKITKLPPDMNPLEDNLTSRHPNSKLGRLSAAERRLLEPLESKRSSGAAYENLLRPPTIPFYHRNSNASTESLSTYHSTPPPTHSSQHSETSVRDLPNRQYQIPSPTRAAPRPSSETSAQSQGDSRTAQPSYPKRASYKSVPLSEDLREPQYTTTSPTREEPRQANAWYAANPLVSAKKATYEPLVLQTMDDFEFSFARTTDRDLMSDETAKRPTVASELSMIREESRDYSSLRPGKSQSGTASDQASLQGKYYGDLRPATPPVMVGSTRQLSTGTDARSNAFALLARRDVSGKVVEEGRGGGWGDKLRRMSGRY